jgi:polyhydroxyalkanoate synthase subunit PhaC
MDTSTAATSNAPARSRDEVNDQCRAARGPAETQSLVSPRPTRAGNHAPGPEPLGFEAFRSFDRMRIAMLAQATGGLSPASLSLAYIDWWIHLANAQGKRAELVWKAANKASMYGGHLLACSANAHAAPCIDPLPGDMRFAAEAWRRPPFCFWAQSFLLAQQWWHNATHEVPGVAPHHEEVVSFAARQMLDVLSPSNTPFTNPEVIERTLQTGGANFVRGYRNWIEDATRTITHQPARGSDAFQPGRDVAATPGKVVFRNHLIELIQYAPSSSEVFAEPVLIVPAWIMKYYILDLSPHNSLVRYLVAQGHTVFCISWRNPGAEDRDLTLDDYRRLGVMAAFDAVNAIVPDEKIHATGYCIGGTLLAIAAAAMARANDRRVGTITLFAAQTDFTEPGELALFIDHSQWHMLESMMWNRGYLSNDQMAGAFQLLRTNDLIWSRLVREYLMGETPAINDLMAWNADSTRMPYRMHAEYLKRLYLDNELATDRFMVEGRAASVRNIRVPMFAVGTERDHVAPWRSVYKINMLTDTDVTFVLTTGGHNAGIVSEPGRRNRSFRIALKRQDDICLSPEEWVAATEAKNGSWWPQWAAWLAQHSSAQRRSPPPLGQPAAGDAPLCDAPGTYVFQR